MSVPFPAPSLRARLLMRAGLGIAIIAGGIAIGRMSSLDPTLILGATMAALWGIVFVRTFYDLALTHVTSPALRTIILGGLALRVPVVLAHLAVGFWVFGGAVDFLGYFGNASQASVDIFKGDFTRLEMGEDPDVGGWVVTVLFVPIYLLIGPSLFGTFLWSAIIGFLGAVFFLRAFMLEYGTGRDTRVLAVCLFFYPSAVFWSSLLGKDSWIYFFLGLATYGLVRMLRDPSPRTIAIFLLGASFVLIIRPPIGAAVFLAAVAATLVASRSWIAELRGAAAVMRPIMVLVIAVGITVGATAIVMGPLQRYSARAESGSFTDALLVMAVEKHVGFASEEDTQSGAALTARIVEPTLGGVLQFLPLALLTFFFRPHIFEAHNAVALMAAVDSTLLAALLLWRVRHLFRSLRVVARQPVMTFALLAAALFSGGLAFENNLGAIVRHRVMVLPFVFLLISVPRVGERERSEAEA